MESDPGETHPPWHTRVQARLRGSRKVAASARDTARAQSRYAHAAAARAHAQSDRNVNEWPAILGLAPTCEGQRHEAVADLVLDTARALFDSCSSVSLTVVDQLDGGNQLHRTAAATGIAEIVDQVQYRLGEGPCIEAVELDMVVIMRADDLADPAARRDWPGLSRAAEGLGVRSAMSIGVPWSPFSVGVHPERRSLGAINFYAPEPHAFGQTDPYGTMFGCWAGAIMGGKKPAEMLRV